MAQSRSYHISMIFLNIILFLVSLSILVLVHEYGHFYVAKKAGVPVEEFGIGFPPRAFSWEKGGTLYSINWVPLGGFVKLRGEENPDDKQGFLGQKPSKKMAIAVAGVVMNLFFAYLLISFGYLIGVPDSDASYSNVTILQVLPGSVAERNGLQMGDRILSFKTKDGIVEVKDPRELRDITEKYAGQYIDVRVQRGNSYFWKNIRPEVTRDPQKGPLGVMISSVTLVKKSFPSNFFYGAKRMWTISGKIFDGLKNMLVGLLTRTKTEEAGTVMGPIGIFNIFQQMRVLGIAYLFHFWALISLNLAFLNLLPLPALDGGRIAFNIIELLRGKPVPLQYEVMVHTVGFGLLLLLLLFVSIKDVKHLLR